MRITLFTPEEANQLLVRIRPELERLAGLKREFDRLESRIDVLKVATFGAAEANPDAAELRACRDQRLALGQAIGKGLAGLQETGVLVKDVDRGLCDFYTLSGDRLVFLCWQIGEPEVAHWHTLDGGYSGRRPLKNAELE